HARLASRLDVLLELVNPGVGFGASSNDLAGCEFSLCLLGFEQRLRTGIQIALGKQLNRCIVTPDRIRLWAGICRCCRFGDHVLAINMSNRVFPTLTADEDRPQSNSTEETQADDDQ